jgi:hypothetical protein
MVPPKWRAGARPAARAPPPGRRVRSTAKRRAGPDRRARRAHGPSKGSACLEASAGAGAPGSAPRPLVDAASDAHAPPRQPLSGSAAAARMAPTRSGAGTVAAACAPPPRARPLPDVYTRVASPPAPRRLADGPRPSAAAGWGRRAGSGGARAPRRKVCWPDDEEDDVRTQRAPPGLLTQPTWPVDGWPKTHAAPLRMASRPGAWRQRRRRGCAWLQRRGREVCCSAAGAVLTRARTRAPVFVLVFVAHTCSSVRKPRRRPPGGRRRDTAAGM